MDIHSKNHKCSIIVPVHNAESTLREAVESLAGQQYPALEVILVENNSSDSSWPLCCELQSQYTQVVCVQTKKVGVSAARNIGLRMATGDIIGFCDADDRYLEGALLRLDELFHTEPLCAAIVTGYQVHKIDGRVSTKSVDRTQIWQFSELADHVLYDNRIMGSVWNKFFRKEVVQDIWFDEALTYCEDMHFLMQLLTRTPKNQAKILNICTYAYYENPKSATSSQNGLFTADNKLKYTIALDQVLGDCTLQGKTRRLAGRAKYQIAYQCKNQFELDPPKRRVLSNIMEENLKWYLATIYVEPIKTIKVLTKQVLGRNR